MNQIDEKKIQQSEWISRYLEKDLQGEELLRFEEKLFESEELQKEVEALRKMVNRLETLTPVEASADFVSNLKRKLRKEKRRKGYALNFQHRVPIEIILIVILCVIAVWFFLTKN